MFLGARAVETDSRIGSLVWLSRLRELTISATAFMGELRLRRHVDDIHFAEKTAFQDAAAFAAATAFVHELPASLFV